MRGFRNAICLVCAALIPGGCQVVAAGVAAPMIIQQKHVNLTNASYAAVDSLSQQAGKRFNKDWPLIVSDLREIVNAPRETIVTDFQEDVGMKPAPPIANPKVGRVLAEQMRSRFVQLGYKVSDADSYAGGGHGALGEVSGTYEILYDTMTVSLKMTDRRTGEIITVYNYSLPVTYDIKKHMADSANILPPLF